MIEWIKNALTCIKGWKTVIVGTIVAAAPGLLELLDWLGMLDVTSVLTPTNAAIAITVIGALKVLLRLVTDTPVGGGAKDA